jgi:hypothetical protein
LGNIGVLTQQVRDCVLWAFRYEDQAGVRAEACHTITSLRIKGKDIGQALQDRYLVETSDIVKRYCSCVLSGTCLDVVPSFATFFVEKS